MNVKRFIVIGAVLAGIAGFSTAAIGEDKSESQKTFDKNMENAKQVYDRDTKAKEKEQMRDKTHDNRVKVGKDTSVGVQTETDPPSVNVKTKTE